MNSREETKEEANGRAMTDPQSSMLSTEDQKSSGDNLCSHHGLTKDYIDPQSGELGCLECKLD